MVQLTSLALATTTLLFQLAQGQSNREWQQCGGIDYPGPTDCPTGWTCNSWNEWYYQCIPSTVTATSSTTSSTTRTCVVSTYTGASTSFVVSLRCPTPVTETVSTTSSSFRYYPS